MIRFTQPHIVFFFFFLLLSPATIFSDGADGLKTSQPESIFPKMSSSLSFVLILAIFCVFVFVGFYFLFLLHCSETIFDGGNSVHATAGDGSSGGGIDPKTLDTFPILVYSAIKDLKIGKEALECAICLSEFKDHDSLRLIPNCSHVFHPDCIDAWLKSHVTCPVCRANLKNEIAIVIPNETNTNTNARNVFDESSVTRSELNNNSVVETELTRRATNLVRSHTTGHSLYEGEKEMVERYTLRLPEEVRKQILGKNHGGIRRSASYHVCWSSRKGYRNNEEDEGSSRWKQTRQFGSSEFGFSAFLCN